MIRILLLFSYLLSCMDMPIDARRKIPRGWTLDAEKQQAVDEIGVEKTFDDKEYLELDSFDAAKGITEEVIPGAADNVAAIEDMIERQSKLAGINKALGEKISEFEGKTCFQHRKFQELEVHVLTSISGWRSPKEEHWPKISVDLGETTGFAPAPVLDGGRVVFKRTYLKEGDKERTHNMESIQQINLELEPLSQQAGYEAVTVFANISEPLGQKVCIGGGNWIGMCKKWGYRTDVTNIEGNQVTVHWMAIYAKFEGDSSKYRIFSTPLQEKVVVLRDAVRSYSISDFKSNPFWVMHYYSDKCNSWEALHDGSEFGKKVWELASSGQPVGGDIFHSHFGCEDRRDLPILLPPGTPEPSKAKKIHQYRRLVK